MGKNFQPQAYIKQILKNLVHEFDSSSDAGTPGLIGYAREGSARKQLEKLLPGIAAIGSGLMVDSYDAVSKQQDIVIYERNFCPVFTINDAPEATYYPCEGVIAVGEVKSTMGTKELEDAFEKIASVKRCQRYLKYSKGPIASEATVAFRKYGASISMEGTKTEELNPQENELDQIWGFILCNDFNLQTETLLRNMAEIQRKYPAFEVPSLIVSLTNGFMQFGKMAVGRPSLTALNAEDIMYSEKSELGFSLLVRSLNFMIRSGRTTEAEGFLRYFTDKEKTHYTPTMSYNFNNKEITKF